jgi:uracil-DNA glycosylase family 4
MASSTLESLAALAWLNDAGADEAIGEKPVNRFMAAKAHSFLAIDPQGGSLPDPLSLPPAGLRPRAVFRPDAGGRITPSIGGAIKPTSASESDSIGRAIELAAAANSLAELRSALEAFDGCSLKGSATNTVFADGTPKHHIMLIGEAPGRDEDLAGLPFVGRAGKLLDKMLASIGLDRKSNVYITNVLNWRPPENRDPSPEEAAICLPFLRRHIELVSPAILIVLGAVAARHVLGKTDGIMRLRGKWLEYYVNGVMVPVMPTLHPAYLLRRPIDKKLAWRDLQAIADKVNSLGLLEQSAARG